MKQRKPPKAVNVAARALYTNKLFAHKSMPNKKGKGSVYKRSKIEDRGDHSGPFSLHWCVKMLTLLCQPKYA
jgi:stalled ribosome alternative rescue factor ArfA